MFDAATALSWQDRIDNYARVMKLPVHMAVGPGDRLFGIWNMGNDYRVSSGYYGGYPATYQRRVKALFPDKLHVLHLFSGKVDLATCPGDSVDINPSLSPTYLDDAQTLLGVPLEQYDLVLADPPYSVEDAEHYQTTMVKRTLVMRALGRLRPGAHVVWLDQVKPQYRKDTFDLVGEIGMSKSTNHRYRVVTFFRKNESESPAMGN
jgi:hypothetical protein